MRSFTKFKTVKFDVETEEPIRGKDGFCIPCAPGEPGELIGPIDVFSSFLSFFFFFFKICIYITN